MFGNMLFSPGNQHFQNYEANLYPKYTLSSTPEFHQITISKIKAKPVYEHTVD